MRVFIWKTLLLEFQITCTPRTLAQPKTVNFYPTFPLKNYNQMTKEDRMQKALDELNTGESIDYSKVARKWEVNRSTLSRRHRDVSRSKEDFLSESVQLLSKDQEETLISHINDMTNRGAPPTSQIVRNLAEEVRGSPIGKNWTAGFVRRHRDRLLSPYLRNIEGLRVKADYEPLFHHFYDLVS